MSNKENQHKNQLQNQNKEERNFGISSFAVDNSTSILLLTVMIFLFGLKSYDELPKEAYPEITFPKLFINTVYFGNSPKDIENLVTIPLERELSTISEIKEMSSNSLQDYSIIELEFIPELPISEALRKVKDAVDKAKSELPNDLTSDPDVIDVNFSEIPIVTVNVSGPYSYDALKKYAEYLEEELKDIPEISDVEMKGMKEREVHIEVDLGAMEARKISFQDIENAVRSENLTMSGGEILKNDFRRTISVSGQFKNVQELRELTIKAENQAPVYLKDIAAVSMGFKDLTSISRANGNSVISLDIIKKSGQNLLDAADNIKVVIAEAKKEVIPEDIAVSLFNDVSVQTRDMVSNLENSIISGVILVVVVLLLFLGVRNAMFVGLAIPLSMLLGIMVLGIIGYTMNMMVLFGLILALGMLVDNAIVIVENIYRYRSEGYTLAESAKLGTGEVAIPVIASTATTLAAFLPLAFWPGLMGGFMKYLPITLIIVLISSLFVGLVINPVIASKFMKVENEIDRSDTAKKRSRRNSIIFLVLLLIVIAMAHFMGYPSFRNLIFIFLILSIIYYLILSPLTDVFQRTVLPFLENSYNSFIRFTLKGIVPFIVFASTIGLLFLSLKLLGIFAPKVEYFPVTEPNYINAFVELPLGKDIEATNRIMKDIEVKVEEIIEPYRPIVEDVLSQIGENTADPAGPPRFGASPNRGRVTISFVPSQFRKGLSSKKALADLRQGLKGFPGIAIIVDQNADGPPQQKPINIEVKGEKIEDLAVVAENMMAFLNKKDVPGVEKLTTDISIGKPEMEVSIDRKQARLYGLSTFSIADALRTSVFGKEISKFKDGDDDYDIIMRANENYRYNTEGLMNQKLTFRSPNGQISQIPISTVSKVSYGSTFNSISRKDEERSITIFSNVLEADGFNANEVVAELKEVLSDFPLPAGISYKFTGQQEEMAKEMAFLIGAFTLAIFVIFIIIVSQFNSIISPFIIILSVLFSTIGVFLGYILTGRNIVIIMTGIGIVSLAGIVVNNAIVLVDYINLLIQKKRESQGISDMMLMDNKDVQDVIIKGGGTRLRPVLLTAITTILGLIPLAIGFNINFFTLVTDFNPQIFIGGDNAVFWGTMAWTVVYGLVFATFLTLVIVPVMYWLAFLMKKNGIKLFSYLSSY